MQGPIESMIKENCFGSKNFNIPANISTDARLAEGKFLHEEQILGKAKSLINRVETGRPTVSKTGQNLETKYT
jgi:hypothetical protein